MWFDVKKLRFKGGPVHLIDTQTRRSLHDDRVASLHRAALPPAPVDPLRRPRIRRSLGRSLVVLGVKVARDPMLDVRFEASRPAA
jgi:hypothetical protein